MSVELEKKPFYSEKEFCDLMGITRKTAFKWREKKMIGYMRTPTGLIRYRQSDIDEYARRNGVRAHRERNVA